MSLINNMLRDLEARQQKENQPPIKDAVSMSLIKTIRPGGRRWIVLIAFVLTMTMIGGGLFYATGRK